MMLEHIGETDKTKKIRTAIANVVKEGKFRTYDMLKLRGSPQALNQGAASTYEATDGIIERL